MITTRRRALQQTTVHFSVTIETDNEQALQDIIGLCLLPFMMLWQFWQAASRAAVEVRLFCQDAAGAVKYVKRTWAARLSLLVYQLIGIRLWSDGKLYRQFSYWS